MLRRSRSWRSWPGPDQARLTGVARAPCSHIVVGGDRNAHDISSMSRGQRARRKRALRHGRDHVLAVDPVAARAAKRSSRRGDCKRREPAAPATAEETCSATVTGTPDALPRALPCAESAPLATIAFIPEPPDRRRLHRRRGDRPDSVIRELWRSAESGPKQQPDPVWSRRAQLSASDQKRSLLRYMRDRSVSWLALRTDGDDNEVQPSRVRSTGGAALTSRRQNGMSSSTAPVSTVTSMLSRSRIGASSSRVASGTGLDTGLTRFACWS
jgi:hypothetical protein